MNLIMADVEETKTIIPEGEEAVFIDSIGTLEKVTRNMPMVFVRGDSIILAAPLN
jgi:small nuclear ribonucleoprotein (snRNP)-like protein